MMKASELIDELKSMIAKHGDLDVYSYDYADNAYLTKSPHVQYNDDIKLYFDNRRPGEVMINRSVKGFEI